MQCFKVSSDLTLDTETWDKSMEKVDLDILSALVYSASELSFSDLCLLRRHDFWERHDESLVPVVRV